MKSRKIVNIALISMLLCSVALGAEEGACRGGACFATLSHSKHSKVVELKKETNLAPYVEIKKYLEKENDSNAIDKSKTIILDGEKVTVFPPETYVMSEEEAMDFILKSNPMEVTEERILEKTDLPSSAYFCEKDKQPVYLNNDIYECV